VSPIGIDVPLSVLVFIGLVCLATGALRHWIAIGRPARPTTLDQFRELLMVRRVNRLITRHGIRYYVLSCGHEVIATDYRYALTPKTKLERPLKSQAFCSTCWSVERTRPAGELR
jgi:hypothetical protein